MGWSGLGRKGMGLDVQEMGLGRMYTKWNGLGWVEMGWGRMGRNGNGQIGRNGMEWEGKERHDDVQYCKLG